MATSIQSTAKLRYRQCSRCLMDTSAAGITFNSDGHCNFCTDYKKNMSAVVFESVEDKAVRLDDFVSRVKANGKGKPYDCVIGVSGGVDSSWTLVKAVELGLRPLAVHMDNGWNAELAQNNISNIVKTLGIDLHTHVINWAEYKKLMQAFFDADVIDVELLYDNAMLAVNYGMAKKYGLKFILSGSNSATEGMSMPSNWNWFKFDKKNIFAIANRFGASGIKSFPAFSAIDYVSCEYLRGIKWVPFLDYLHFNKDEALSSLEHNYGYKRYPYKHYESIFTRFYQGYLLPEKFGVDKRLMHFSSLIMADQISREDALEKASGIAYESEEKLKDDKQYFLKKMGWSEQDLAGYLKREEKSHALYGTEKPLWDLMLNLRAKLPTRLIKALKKEK